MPKAIVIGAGIAGIAASLRLKAQGFEVEVHEANPYTGGKLHAISQDGYRFDLGPSLFTMPQFVEELFALFGEDVTTHFEYIQKEVICNYFWSDGTTFSAKSDKQEYIEELCATFGESPKKVTAFLNRNKEKYELTAPLFLENSLHKIHTYLNTNTIKSIAQLYKLHIFQSLDKTAKAYFKNTKTVQLVNRYATYNGSNPYKTPGIMSLIPHLEQYYGTFFPKGGMHRISQSLYELGLRQNISYHLNSKVSSILTEKGRAAGIELENGEHRKADLVICNMDVFPTYKQLLATHKAPEKTLAQERSSSALIFYWGIEKSFPNLDLHNIFFSDDYQNEFEYLFDKKSICDDPTVYVNISSKDNPEDAPKNCENWFVMINAPAHYNQDWNALVQKTRVNILRKLSKILNTDIEALIATEYILEPSGIEKNTSSYRGALYGAASNDTMAAFLRHPNFNKKIKNLYHCGGSVHPGGGIPLCMLSAKIVSDLVQHDFNTQ